MPALVMSATLAATTLHPYGMDHYALSAQESVLISENHASGLEKDKHIHTYSSNTAQGNDGLLEVNVSTVSREELTAKLAQNKAEVESVASSMRTEMANFRTAYVESFADISKALNRIESRADATEKRLTQAQWIVSLVISICAVTLSAVIFFSNKTAIKPTQQPTIVVNSAPSQQAPNPHQNSESK